MNSRKFAIASLAAAAGLALGAGVALAQDKKVTLKLSYWVPPSHALTPGYKEWDEALRKATNGTLSIQLFPSSQLGSGPDHYDMVRRGIADIGLINPGYTPGRFPVISVSDLPFQTRDSLKTAAALTQWYKQYAEKEMADVITCHTFTHEPGTFHSVKKEIRVPADIKGMKIRAGNATIAAYINSQGGTPVSVPIMEALETLNRGITEAITIPWGGLVTMHFGKAVKIHTAIPLYVSTFTHNINRRVYNALSPAQRKALDATCTPEFAAQLYRHWGKEERDFEEKLKVASDRKTLTLTPAEIELWRKSAEPVIAQWKASVTKAGYNADEVFASFQKAMRDGGAAY